jgi:hypothetical protein
MTINRTGLEFKAPLLHYWLAITPDSSGSKKEQFRSHLKDLTSTYSMRHHTNDRLNSPYRRLPSSFALSRFEQKLRLKMIGRELAQFKALDDLDRAMFYINSSETEWRDFFDSVKSSKTRSV